MKLISLWKSKIRRYCWNFQTIILKKTHIQKNKKYIKHLIDIEDRIKKENKDEHCFAKLYNEEFKKKFQTLNQTKVSDK